MVDRENPDLERSYNIDDDKGFIYHIQWNECYSGKDLMKEFDKYENGIWCILADGRQLEMRNDAYNYYCMLAKPEYISTHLYYVYCLNKHAEGKNFTEYFYNLHDDVREFISAYPEYRDLCMRMSDKILNYLEKSDIETEEQAIMAVGKLLERSPDEILQFLLPAETSSTI
jgi:hypothetical protein